MNILVLGSGAREHTLSWKIKQSEKLSNLYIAPGNAGTQTLGTNINLTNFDEIKTFVITNQIQIVVVGPEDPLVNGIHDFFLQNEQLKNVTVIGPEKLGATLEGSKEFAKEFMSRHNIPTAKYKSFTKDNLQDGYLFLESLNAPYVLKSDGLAAGKGVLILENLQEAKDELSKMLVDNKFGNASSKVVIEEFLSGIELSCFIITDGKNYKILPTAKDYKRIGEGDKGLNTGGMGAVSPAPFVDDAFMQKIENKIIKPTVEGLQKDNISYKGFIFIGLIKVGHEPFVIEYNVRMGDPETEVVIPLLKNDIVEIFEAIGNQKLKDVNLEIYQNKTATTLMMVSGGYPESYDKNIEITGLNKISDESIVFHAGTKLENNKILTNGGRVLTITSFGNDFKEAFDKSYNEVKKVHFDKSYYRTDLGFDL